MSDLGIESSLSYEEVDLCHGSIEGQNILHDFGVMTLDLDPAMTWAPWVTINGVRSMASVCFYLRWYYEKSRDYQSCCFAPC